MNYRSLYKLIQKPLSPVTAYIIGSYNSQFEMEMCTIKYLLKKSYSQVTDEELHRRNQDGEISLFWDFVYHPSNRKQQSNQIFSEVTGNSASNQDTSKQTRTDKKERKKKSKTHFSYFIGEISDEVINKRHS